MARRTGNRTHHKVEQLTCRQQVDQMLQGGHTYEEIQRAVREAGESIGIASLSRYHSRYSAVAERIQRSREAMKGLLDEVRDRPNIDLAEALSEMVKQGLMDRVSDALMQGEEFDELSLSKVIKAVADLQRADVARERLKLQFSKGVDAAVAVVKEQLRVELGQRPDLIEQLYRVVDQAAETAKTQAVS